MKGYIIINEQHRLQNEQQKLLKDRYRDGYIIHKIPAGGLDYSEQLECCESILQECVTEYELLKLENGNKPSCTVNNDGVEIVFVSPIPVMIMLLSRWQGAQDHGYTRIRVVCMHNPLREKVETDDGKVFYRVPVTGWEIV